MQVGGEAQRADPGRPREAHRAVQLGRRGRRERREDGPPLHRARGHRRLRPRLPRPHQPHAGPDREEHALQAPLRAVRERALPGADGLPLPLAGWRRALRRRGVRLHHRPDPRPDRRGQLRGRHHRADPGRGRLHRAAAGLPARRSPHWCRDHGILLHRRRGAERLLSQRRLVRLRRRGRRPRPDHVAKGIAGGMPLAARHRARRPAGLPIHPGGLGGTYGGNPVACAAALAAIETMEEEDLVERARQIEDILKDRLVDHRREVRRGRRGARPRRDDRHGARHRPRHQGAGRRAHGADQRGVPLARPGHPHLRHPAATSSGSSRRSRSPTTCSTRAWTCSRSPSPPPSADGGAPPAAGPRPLRAARRW